jgi:ABC-type transport system involved in multi-copper enzyme maturation permease subunit
MRVFSDSRFTCWHARNWIRNDCWKWQGIPLDVLFVLSLLFLLCGLGLGLFVSTLAKSQLAAIQFAFIIMLPSVLLSGFMFVLSLARFRKRVV